MLLQQFGLLKFLCLLFYPLACKYQLISYFLRSNLKPFSKQQVRNQNQFSAYKMEPLISSFFLFLIFFFVFIKRSIYGISEIIQSKFEFFTDIFPINSLLMLLFMGFNFFPIPPFLPIFPFLPLFFVPKFFMFYPSSCQMQISRDKYYYENYCRD